MKAQALAIIAVIGTGVAMFTMYLSTFESLGQTKADYYSRGRFGDVFAACKRAPNWVGERVAEIPGVAEVSTRVIVDVTLDIPGFSEPARGRLLSIPEVDRDTLNDLSLRSGRYIEAGSLDEVIVHEAFAEEHGLEEGDRIAAIINGRRRSLTVVGIGLSPEYVYVIGPGDLIPDRRRFGVFWMGRDALAAAFDMEGGFNHVSLRIASNENGRQSVEAPVIAELDLLLEPYGGLSATERRYQQSNWFVENELREMRTMASILPVIFLGVAAFLLNIVLSRSIAVQRTQIAVFKAIGYRNREIAGHYLAFGLLIAGLGAVFGSVAGAYLGSGLTHLYAEYFRFPNYAYTLAPRIPLAAAGISLAAAAFGSLSAVRRAVALPPADSMRPEPPARFEKTRLEEMGLQVVLGPSGRMILRNIARRPWRFVLSSFGVGMAIALLILGSFLLDAIDYLIALQFDQSQRQDITVTFVEPQSARSVYEIERFSGVLSVEPFRAVPVRFRNQNRSRRIVLLGLPAKPELSRVVDRHRGPIELPRVGVVLSAALAEILNAKVGDEIIVEVLEGARPRRSIAVSMLVDDLLGLSAYMEANAMAELMREDLSLSGAFLSVDPYMQDSLFHELKQTPQVASVGLNGAVVESFRQTIEANLMRTIFFNILFSAIIAVGVVYNAARISLSEHSRDLASLRVLGFTRHEISLILLGELALVTLLALPLGMLCGRVLAGFTLAMLRNELYRIPLIIEPSTYAVSVLTVVFASLVSGLLVRRRLTRLDLISVLKTNE